jgi:protein-disulfide isomerase
MRHPVSFLCTLALLTLPLAACVESGGEAAPAPSSAVVPEAPPGLQDVDIARMGFNEGNEESAVVRVVEFSDFGCVFCARFHESDYHELYREFVASGDVVWKYIPITIGGFPNGEGAAIAGECAGAQGRFAPMRDLLYDTREEWMGEAANPQGLFRGYAERVGLDLPTFDACVQGDEAEGRLAEANRVAVAIGVRGTPTFIVEGFPVQGAPPLDAFQDALRDLIAQARSQAEGGTPGR